MAGISNIEIWIMPLSFFLGGLLLGLVVEKIVMRTLKRAALITRWQVDNVIIESLRRMPFFWLFLTGLYGAVLTNPIITAIQRKPLEKLIVALFILSATVAVARVAAGFVDLYNRKRTGMVPSATILKNLARVFIYLLGVLTIFRAFGLNITPALTALGIGGLAVALALQDTLSNFFSGLQLIASKQISPGDYLKLESGDEGYVTDITWRNTTLRTLPNNRIIVPNSKMASNIVTNYHLPDKQIAVLLPVGVSYSSDLAKVERITVDVAREIMKEVPGGVPEFEPFIRYSGFGDFSINFTVILRGKEYVDQHIIKHEFMKKLHQRYSEQNIEIPFPIRTLQMMEPQITPGR